MSGAYCCGSQIETGLSLQCLHATWDALCLTGSWLPQQSCHGLEDSAQPTKALILLFIPKYCKLGAQCHFRLLTEQWMELMIKTNMQISMHTAGISADFSITWSNCVPPMKHRNTPRQPEWTVAPSRLRRFWQCCDFIESDQKLRGPTGLTLEVLERTPWWDVPRLLETSAKRADVWKPISCDMPRCM